jgi:hypothetical protein
LDPDIGTFRHSHDRREEELWCISTTFSVHLKNRLTRIDSARRLNSKRSGKLISKTSRPLPNLISSPPKAAIATSSANKDEVHRRRNPLNDVLGRRSRDAGGAEKHPSPPLQHVEFEDAVPVRGQVSGVDAKGADRNAELERALATAQEEQIWLRDQLEEAKKRAVEHKDTITELRRQLHHAALPRDGSPSFHTPDSVVENSPERETDALRYRVGQLESQLTLDAHNRARTEADLNMVRTRLHATEKESQERLQQLLSLKTTISSLTRSESQVTDSELTGSFSQLANRIREWVVSNDPS